MTSGTLIRPEPPEPPEVGARRRKNPLSPKTTLGRQRIVGAFLFLALFGVFFSQNRFPKLDIVREDVAIATREVTLEGGVPADEITNCFQGFCFDPEQGLWETWWDFSLTYIDLVTVGMIFAFLVAGLVDAFLFPTSSGPAFGKRGWRGSLQGLTVGPLMTLCSACIVPVANSFKKQGAGVEATIAITQGSATLNAPAIFMIFVVFSPLLAVSRVALSVVGALALGPLVAWLVNRRREGEALPSVDDMLGIVDETGPPDPWVRVVLEGSKNWLVSAWRFFYRLAPIMVIAGFIGGFAIQFLTEDGVSTILGNHLLGVAIAATVGVLINVPLLFEIPLVAGLMLLGMGIAPAATLLFAAAAAGPITFWGLAGQIGRKGVAWYAATTWSLAAVGGIAVIGLNAAFPAGANTPTIEFDGAACEYRGPAELSAEMHEFRAVNLTERAGDGHTMAIVVGRLPDDVTLEEFSADVASDPRGTLPLYFTVTGEDEFIFPGTAHRVPVVFHNPGEYAVVCLNGGGLYVILEFSMPQPTGWFEEFGSTFQRTVAPEGFSVVAE